MIPIFPETYFEIFLFLVLIVGVIAWSYYLWQQHLEKWEISEEKLCRCKNCSLTYIVARGKKESECSRCGEQNTLEEQVEF